MRTNNNTPTVNPQAFLDVAYVFLDRDGVINKKLPEGQYVKSWEEFELLPDVEAAIGRLNLRGYKVIVVSNQRGVALGYCTLDDLHKIHDQLHQHLAARNAYLDAIYVCPHAPNTCECRKPAPGLFLQAFRDYPKATPQNSVLIGDSLADMQAARAVGIRGILIVGASDTRKPGFEQAIRMANATAESLEDAVRRYLHSCHDTETT